MLPMNSRLSSCVSIIKGTRTGRKLCASSAGVLFAFVVTAVLSLEAVLAGSCGIANAQQPSSRFTTWAVTIVLPPKLVAGRRATLAVLGVDGRLASGVTIELSDGQHVTTDRTGRASFVVPATGQGYVLASGSGASVSALVDLARPVDESQPAVIDAFASLSTPFSICAGGLSGDADANRVEIGGEPALVLASSPECAVMLSGRKSTPGPVRISIEGPGVRYAASTTLVSLECEYPKPPLEPGKKGALVVRVRGSEQKLRIIIENGTPGVLKFSQGTRQEVLTSGGAQNIAALRVEALSSGDYSFRARLLNEPDVPTALRFLQLAEPLAPAGLQHDIQSLRNHLADHPRNFEAARQQLGELISETITGDFRTLLSAADSAL